MPDSKIKRRGRHRLKSFSYTGTWAHSITLYTHQRQHLFKSRQIVHPVLHILQDTAERFGFRIWAYCFMPDHLHILVQGSAPRSHQPGFMHRFKQMSGYAHKRQHGRKLWQESYYEHILRTEETIAAVARYIFENPVRKGLVETPAEWPFSGFLEGIDPKVI